MESEVNSILVAAHELKAPLNLMRQLTLALDDQPTATEAAHLRKKLLSLSDRTIKQVNDLTKIARLEDGLFPMEPVSVRAVCDDVTRELATLFTFNHRRLEVAYKNRSRLAVANRDLLHSVIYNFCLNAAHYSTDETESRLTVRDYRNTIRVNIRDYGPALPVDVWRELKRGWLEKPTTISMRPGSSGLGLYIASQFSKYMHAKIGATRHRDGTSFFVELPVSNQASLF